MTDTVFMPSIPAAIDEDAITDLALHFVREESPSGHER